MVDLTLEELAMEAVLAMVDLMLEDSTMEAVLVMVHAEALLVTTFCCTHLQLLLLQ